MTFNTNNAENNTINGAADITQSITTATGWEIPSGTSKGFYMSEAVVDDVEAICAPGVTGTLKWYVNSFYE